MTAPTRPAKPTAYRGTNFRSRLEARWAAFFDLVGWSWIYEPFDADGWIPDFLIEGEHPILVEVGPCANDPEFEAKSAKPTTYRDRPTVILGLGPNVLGSPYCGWITNETPGFAGVAFWTIGRDGRELGLYQDTEVHYPGLGTWATREHTEANWLAALWQRAGNDVQWRAPESLRSVLNRQGWRP